MNNPVNDAHAFLNELVKSQKLLGKVYKSLDGVKVLSVNNSVQLVNLAHWCELLDMPYIKEDWDGNAVCNSNDDIIYFVFKGITFFELIDKEETNERQ